MMAFGRRHDAFGFAPRLRAASTSRKDASTGRGARLIFENRPLVASAKLWLQASSKALV